MFTPSLPPPPPSPRPPLDSPCPAGVPERSSSHEGPPPEAEERGLCAQDAPGPRPRAPPSAGAPPRACQPRLTCPRRIRQPLDSSHQAPLEKFPNFFAALHALAPSRPNESQKEETATSRAPGLCIHHQCPSRPFPRSGPNCPRAPCVAGAGKRSAVAVLKRCNLAAEVPGLFWDTDFTWWHLAFSGGARRLRYEFSSRAPPGLPIRRERVGAAPLRKTPETHRAHEHLAPAAAGVAAGSARNSQPETRSPAALCGQAPPLHVPPRPRFRPTPRPLREAAGRTRLSSVNAGPRGADLRAALPGARKQIK